MKLSKTKSQLLLDDRNAHIYSIDSYDMTTQHNFNDFNISIDSKTTKNYWRNLFAIVLLPLIVTGAPVHHVFTDQSVTFTTTTEWLKSIFNTKTKFAYFLIAVNSALLLYVMCANILIVFTSVWILKELLYDGIVPKELTLIIIENLQVLVFIVYINLFWICGYKLKSLMRSLISDFDMNVSRYDSIDLVSKCDDNNDIKLNYGRKMSAYYVIVIFIVVVSLIVSYNRNSFCHKNVSVNNTVNINITDSDNSGMNANDLLCSHQSTTDLVHKFIIEIAHYLVMILYIVFTWVCLHCNFDCLSKLLYHMRSENHF